MITRAPRPTSNFYLLDKAISEDDNKRAEQDIQKMTDQYIEKVDKISADKEKEIMTI